MQFKQEVMDLKVNPYLISNFNITSSNNDGIYVTGTTEYFRIENNLIEVSDTGIEIDTVPIGTGVITQNIVVSSVLTL